VFLPILAYLIGGGGQTELYAGAIEGLAGAGLDLGTLRAGSTPWVIGKSATLAGGDPRPDFPGEVRGTPTGCRSEPAEPVHSGGRHPYAPDMSALVSLHAGYAGVGGPVLLGVVTLAGAGAAVLLGLAVGAFLHRQSRPYLLIAAAILALFGRSAVAGITAAGAISPADHHVLEHGLDVVLAALVIAAVYHARTTPGETEAPS